jgi:hypothetical protein
VSQFCKQKQKKALKSAARSGKVFERLAEAQKVLRKSMLGAKTVFSLLNLALNES